MLVRKKDHEHGHTDVKEDKHLVVLVPQCPQRQEDEARKYDDGSDAPLNGWGLEAVGNTYAEVKEEKVAQSVNDDV